MDKPSRSPTSVECKNYQLTKFYEKNFKVWGDGFDGSATFVFFRFGI
jgi:hypothetical protein